MQSKRQIGFPKKAGPLPVKRLKEIIAQSLKEDLGRKGDITSQSLFGRSSAPVMARVFAKENGVVCGLEAARWVYRMVDPKVKVRFLKKDGDHVKDRDVLFEVEGNPVSVLKGERTALNFIGLLSGISTKADQLSKLLRGSGTRLLDTRKTFPGLREMEKYAVMTGGAHNHRMGLYDLVLIKENHIAAAGGICAAVETAKRKNPGVPVEIEVETLAQAREALKTEADILMLDNMNDKNVRKAMKLVNGLKYIEVSGNIDPKRLVKLAKIGVDFVSMGALTHTVRNFDISLRLQ